jgi:predicted protein tyrosine phosphatase
MDETSERLQSLQVGEGEGGAAGGTGEQWTCPSCTFLNIPARSRCEVCDSARAGSAGAAAGTTSITFGSSKSAFPDDILSFFAYPDMQGSEVDGSQINNFIYISAAAAARDESWLLSHGITHVLNAAAGEVTIEHAAPMVVHNIALEDTSHESDALRAVAMDAIAFIDSVKHAGGKVLVHCVAGVSRSVALVTAWLMVSQGMSLREAFAFIREKRHWAYPNFGFWMALREIEIEAHGGAASVSMDALELHVEIDGVEVYEEVEGDEGYGDDGGAWDDGDWQ